jgi:hypothetical protein
MRDVTDEELRHRAVASQGQARERR